MLVSTFYFTVETHFCGDFPVDVSYFGKADNCGMQKEKSFCSLQKITKKDCCKDEVQIIKGQDELQKDTFEKLDLKKQQFIIAFVSSYNSLFNNLSKNFVPHLNYNPPEIIIDIQVLYEVFII